MPIDAHVLGNRVLIRPAEGTEKVIAGIVRVAADKVFEGEVLRMGPLVNAGHRDVLFDSPHGGSMADERRSEEARAWLDRRKIRVGDRVAYSRYAGSTINIEERIYVIVCADDLLCILESTTPEEALRGKCGAPIFDVVSTEQTATCGLWYGHKEQHIGANQANA